MFREGLVDELFPDSMPLDLWRQASRNDCRWCGFTQLSDAYRLRCVERKRKGRELFLRFLREPDGKV